MSKDDPSGAPGHPPEDGNNQQRRRRRNHSRNSQNGSDDENETGDSRPSHENTFTRTSLVSMMILRHYHMDPLQITNVNQSSEWIMERLRQILLNDQRRLSQTRPSPSSLIIRRERLLQVIDEVMALIEEDEDMFRDGEDIEETSPS